MERSKSTKRAISLERKHIRLSIKALASNISLAEKLQNAIVAYKKSMSGDIISVQGVGIAAGIATLEAILPAIIKKNKDLKIKQEKRLR